MDDIDNSLKADETSNSLKAYDKLYRSIPSIGLLSRKKRISAYLKITKMLQKMIDEQEISEENALFILSVLVRKSSPFQKATLMSALNLPTIDRKIFSSIGFRYANEFRCNLKMLPVDDGD